MQNSELRKSLRTSVADSHSEFILLNSELSDEPALPQVIRHQRLDRRFGAGHQVAHSAAGAELAGPIDERRQRPLVFFHQRPADRNLIDIVVLAVDQIEIAFDFRI